MAATLDGVRSAAVDPSTHARPVLDAGDTMPASARLAWWLTAWLRGHEVTDHVLDGVLGGDAAHHVAGLAGAGLPGAARAAGDPENAEPLVTALAVLRRGGAHAAGLALPAEGDPLGLGGPAEFNAAALEAGEAVVVETGAGPVGLVPHRAGAGVVWVARRAARRQLPDVGEADRGLRQALLESTDALVRLDVARWRPEVADRLMDLRHRPAPGSPAGVPPRCVALAGRGLQALDIAAVGLEDDGGAVTALEAARRAEALRPLERAGRRALVAACSPEVWPPE